MDKSKLDQEMESRMRPNIDKWKISAESLEREFESIESPWKFPCLLSFFLFHATQDKSEMGPGIWDYVHDFVESKDTGLNALFLDGIRNGKWSPIYSHRE